MRHQLELHSSAPGKRCAICDAPLPLHLSAGGQDVCRQPACQSRWRLERHRLGARCESCGTLLRGRRGDTVCGRAECQRLRTRRRLQEQREMEDRRRRRAEQWRESVVRRHGVQDDEVLLAIVPSNRDPVANLPERKKRRFRDHLLRVIGEAAARRHGSGNGDDPEQVEVSPAVEPEDPLEIAVLGNACATCRGDCCRLGGDHAFIRPETILRYMNEHPGVRPRDVFAAYFSRLGNRTYRHGCVYQGPRGCTLTRAMRSDVCNRFLCDSLIELQQRYRSTGLQKLVAVGFTDSEEPAIVTYADDSGCVRQDGDS